jgi:hypothetical protein
MKFYIPALFLGLRVSRAQAQNPPNPPSIEPVITFLGEISLPPRDIAGGAQDEEGGVSLLNPFDLPIDEIESGQGDLDGALDEGDNSNGMIPPPTNTFDGIQFGQFTNVPPDTVGDVGPNHYVQMVNVAFAVFNKTTGAVLFPPTPIQVLFSDDQNGCFRTIGDPIVCMISLQITGFLQYCQDQ